MNRNAVSTVARCLAVIAGTAACHSESASVPFAVQDSAGVDIVHNAESAWSLGTPWHLSADPMLAIGSAEAAPQYEFHEIRDAVRLSDGGIVVADEGFDLALRVFNSDGSFRTAFGRRGPGPTEFQQIASIERADADTLIIADEGQRRIAFARPDGTEINSLPYGRSGNVPPSALKRYADGRWIGILSGFAPNEEPSSPGIYQIEAALVVLSVDGTEIDTIGTYPGADIGYIDMGGGGLVRGIVPFGHTLTFAVADSGVYMGYGERLSFDLRSLDGQLFRSIRANGPDLTFTDADFDAFRNATLGALPEGEDRALLNRYLNQIPRPPRKAAYLRMLADAGGNLWLGPYETTYGAYGPWHVFAKSGRYLGEFRIPAQLHPYEIGRDYVLGRWRDDLGVETVRMYGIVKPGP